MGQDQTEPIERWIAKRRANLVLQLLKGETSVPEAARQHGLTGGKWPTAATERRGGP